MKIEFLYVYNKFIVLKINKFPKENHGFHPEIENKNKKLLKYNNFEYRCYRLILCLFLKLNTRFLDLRC